MARLSIKVAKRYRRPKGRLDTAQAHLANATDRNRVILAAMNGGNLAGLTGSLLERGNEGKRKGNRHRFPLFAIRIASPRRNNPLWPTTWRALVQRVNRQAIRSPSAIERPRYRRRRLPR